MSDTTSQHLEPNKVATITRERLPDTRQSLTHKFKIGDLEGYITVGLYPDGRPGEVFIKIAKHGSTVSGLVDTIAVLTSMALQYGVSIDVLARKFEYVRFEPSGWTENDDIRQAHSVVDYLFRWLGLQFSEDYRSRYILVTADEHIEHSHSTDAEDDIDAIS